VRPDALLLLAVPLVPPAARASAERAAAARAVRREELRGPLRAGIPVVVAQGSRDVFGGPGEVRTALGRRPEPGAEVVTVVGADHALRVSRDGADPSVALLRAALRAVALARGE
jgi:predicted alpha/beta-hydrolase family hydrolase